METSSTSNGCMAVDVDGHLETPIEKALPNDITTKHHQPSPFTLHYDCLVPKNRQYIISVYNIYS